MRALPFTLSFALTFTSALALADTSVGRAAAREIVLEYSAPNGGKLVLDEQVRFTGWKPGDRLFRIVDDGAITIAQVGEGASIDGLVNNWYTDAAGTRVFGGSLTPFRFSADFDGDGTPEVATVSFAADFQIRVRIGDSELLMRPAGGAYLSQKGGNVSAHLETVFGIPMLKIGSHPEACSDYFDTYVSYAGGKAQVALELGGLADPPVHSTPSVKFEPKTRTAVVSQTNSEEDEKGGVHVHKSVTRYHLVGGVFRK